VCESVGVRVRVCAFVRVCVCVYVSVHVCVCVSERDCVCERETAREREGEGDRSMRNKPVLCVIYM